MVRSPDSQKSGRPEVWKTWSLEDQKSGRPEVRKARNPKVWKTRSSEGQKSFWSEVQNARSPEDQKILLLFLLIWYNFHENLASCPVKMKMGAILSSHYADNLEANNSRTNQGRASYNVHKYKTSQNELRVLLPEFKLGNSILTSYHLSHICNLIFFYSYTKL